MLVALTMRITNAAQYHDPRDSIAQDWIRCLSTWKMTPLLIPNQLSAPGEYLDIFRPDLIILTGGDDPSIEDARQKTEAALIDFAIAGNIPLLGVCRGMQFINTYFGGALVNIEGHVGSTHEVDFVTSGFQEIYGSAVTVNSFHNTGITEEGLADQLRPAAVYGDTVEAFMHKSEAMAGLMWHPERNAAPSADQDFIRRFAGKEIAP